MPELLIGCPVAWRHKFIPLWMKHVRDACFTVGITPSYVFVADHDDPTVDAILEHAMDAKIHWEWIEDPNARSLRDWCDARYRRMVELRNLLLGRVREIRPDHFLSLDSDIMLHTRGIQVLLEGIEQFPVVGGKCYMSPAPDRTFPSAAMLTAQGTLLRQDFDYGPTPVDVVMGVKLMTPEAYEVDYQYHGQGEDTGWCAAVKQHGLQPAWHGGVTNKHCMTEAMLNIVDPRCGF